MNLPFPQLATFLLLFSQAHFSSVYADPEESLCSYDDYNLALVVRNAAGLPPNSQVGAVLDMLGERMSNFSNKRHDSGELSFGIIRTDFSVVSVEFEAGKPFDRFNATCASIREFNEALVASFTLDFVYAVRDMEADFFSSTREAAVYNSKSSTENLSKAPTPSPTADLSAKIVETPPPTSPPTSSIVSTHDANGPKLRGSSPTRTMRIRSYEELFLSLVVPGATSSPTKVQAREALELLSDDFITFVRSGFDDKSLHFNIEEEELHLNSIDFEKGIPYPEFNVLIKFVPAIECYVDAQTDQCPTQEELEEALMGSFAVQYIFELQKLGDGYFSNANEAVLRKSAKPAVATQAPVVTPSLMTPSSSPAEATSADQDLSTTVRLYEDLYLALSAPTVSILPSDSQAEQVIKILGATFVDNANSVLENKAVVGVDFSLLSVQFGEGIPTEKYNVLVKFSPRVNCVPEAGGCLADDDFRTTLFDSFSEELLYTLRGLKGGFFSSLTGAYLLSSKSKIFADHGADDSGQDDRKLTQQVWLQL